MLVAGDMIHVCLVVGMKGLAGVRKLVKRGLCFLFGDSIWGYDTYMSCGWKKGLGWDEEVSEKGSVKQTSKILKLHIQIPLTGYVGLILHSTAVATTSHSTIEGTMRVL